MKYYYFAATLPLLAMETAPPFNFAAFRQSCREQMTAADRAAVDFIARDDMSSKAPPKPCFLHRWLSMEVQIRNAIAICRTAAAGADVEPRPKTHAGYQVDIEPAVKAAFKLDSPLERERALDGLRWRLLEQLAGPDPFALDALLSYACRLRLSERWTQRSESAGRENFDRTVARIIESPGE